MDNAALVDIDIAAGDRVLHILDAAGFKADVALWLYSSEFEEWRLVIATPLFDLEGAKQAYVRLLSALQASEPELATSVTITLVSPKDDLVRGLRRTFGSTKSVHGMRLGGNVVNGVFIERAYVYRIR
jgi:hypothetical protein